MNDQQLFPRPPRRMKQPTKEQLRQAVAELTLQVERLRAENEHLRRRPWWRRILRNSA